VNRAVVGFAAALGVGLLAGALYQLMGVPTPAPPWWALCGLLGIVVGERGVAAVRDRASGRYRCTRGAPAEEGSPP